MTRYPFKIPIGDWSNDGHGRCEYFYATAAKSVKDVEKAWKHAVMTAPPDTCPHTFCDEYQDSCVSDEVLEALTKAGAPVREAWRGQECGLDPADMAAIVVWFLNLGDSNLDARLELEVPRLHIDAIGYGLFQ